MLDDPDPTEIMSYTEYTLARAAGRVAPVCPPHMWHLVEATIAPNLLLETHECDQCGATEVRRRGTRLPARHQPNMGVIDNRGMVGAVMPNPSQMVGPDCPPDPQSREDPSCT